MRSQEEEEEESGAARAVGGRSPGVARGGAGIPLLFVARETAGRLPVLPPRGLAAALDGRRGPLSRLRLTLRTRERAEGRAGGRQGARPRSAPLYPAPDGGGGGHCPAGAPLALPAPRARATPQLQVGGAGRLCSEPGLGPARPNPHAHFPLSLAASVPRTQGARRSAPAGSGCSLFGLAGLLL